MNQSFDNLMRHKLNNKDYLKVPKIPKIPSTTKTMITILDLCFPHFLTIMEVDTSQKLSIST